MVLQAVDDFCNGREAERVGAAYFVFRNGDFFDVCAHAKMNAEAIRRLFQILMPMNGTNRRLYFRRLKRRALIVMEEQREETLASATVAFAASIRLRK